MITKSKNIIYGRIDPTTKELRYVGQSSIGIRRVKKHACDAVRKTGAFKIAIRNQLKGYNADCRGYLFSLSEDT